MYSPGDLLERPGDIPFLSNLIQREIIYRLLQSPQRDRLRRTASLDGQGRGTARALTWLRANYTKPCRLDQLATVAYMGAPTLSRHFRAITSTTRCSIKSSFDSSPRGKECSSRDWMPQGPLSKSDMRAALSSTASTNASSVNRRSRT